MKITRITIRNFRGIEARDAEIPAAGALIRGGNTKGKTSTINAIRAALAGRDIGPDAIRNGADKAEILVDIDKLRAHRTIRPEKSSLVVTDLATGAKLPRAATMLGELLGNAPIDPLDLFLAKPPERRRAILAALPVTVDRAQLLAWAPELPADFSVEGHGLDVVARAHALYYEQRAAVNREAKASKADAERLEEEAAKAAQKAPPKARDLRVATADLETARAHQAALGERQRQADAAEERSASTRKRIAEIRQAAVDLRANAEGDPGADAIANAHEAALLAQAVQDELQVQLDIAKQDAEAAWARNRLLDEQSARSRKAHADARARDAEAAALEASVAQASAPRVSPAECAAAELAIEEATAAIEGARAAAEALAARDRAKLAKETAATYAERAAKLDDVVQALANQAPAELLAASNGIPGLSVAGDEVLLDGVGLDHVSGAEQMKLAVEIARRANAASKILIVDGLERLDPDQLEVFVREATAGEWQLICTRVDRGEVVIEALGL